MARSAMRPSRRAGRPRAGSRASVAWRSEIPLGLFYEKYDHCTSIIVIIIIIIILVMIILVIILFLPALGICMTFWDELRSKG